MSEELPSDVRSTLAELFEEAAEDARTRDDEAVRSRIETAETVAEEDVPPGAGKARLRHGCAQVRSTVENEPLVAAEYLQAMRRLVEEDDEGDADEGADADADAEEDADDERDDGSDESAEPGGDEREDGGENDESDDGRDADER